MLTSGGKVGDRDMKMIKIAKTLARLCVASACVIMAGIACGAASEGGPSDGSIKVGSCNIRMSAADRGTPNAWDERKEDLAALIQSLELDVFGMQEVCPDQEAFLRGKLKDFEFVGDYRNADRKSGEASPVCYRKSRFEALDKGTFWLSETPDVPGSKGWDARLPRTCSYLVLKDRLTGKRFCFANCHTDHRGALAREKGLLLVIERMKKFGAGVPIVFTGDHNCRETDAPARAVRGLLKDAIHVSEVAPAGAWRSFSAWEWREAEVIAADALKVSPEERNPKLGTVEAHRYGDRIDYIYVSDAVRVLDYRTVDSPRPGKKLYPSDHFPVVATLVLP